MASFRFPFRGMRAAFADAATDPGKWGDLGQRLDRNFDEIERSAGAWRAVGAPGEAVFQNGWANYGAGYVTAAYLKHPLTDLVYVRGTVAAGATSLPIFSLPVGYRPTDIWMYPAYGAVGATRELYRLDVQGDGAVIAYGTTTPSYLAINIVFRCT